MEASSRNLLRTAALKSAQEGYARVQQRATSPVKRRRSASDLVDGLADSVASAASQIRETTERETREHAAKMVTDWLLQPAGRKTFGGKSPDECITEALAFEDMAEVPRLAAAAERFEQSSDFAEGLRAGLLLAARLVADEQYEL